MSKPAQLETKPHTFHHGPIIHSHSACSGCHKVRRFEQVKQLKQCGKCGLAMYCSKECQTADWREHKVTCKDIATDNMELAVRTGIPRARTDLVKWIEYYESPIKNAQVAMFNLPRFPHEERRSFLAVHITHKGDSTLPLQHRFIINKIERCDVGDLDGNPSPRWLTEPGKALILAEIGREVAAMKKEMGRDYYGTAFFIIVANFSPKPYYHSIVNTFSINKFLARAKVANGPWRPPLRLSSSTE